MRLDDLKTWLLANLSLAIAARSTVGVPLTMFTAKEIVLRDYEELATGKMLYLDQLEDTVEPGTNHRQYVTERIDAYAIVTRGASEAVMRDQAHQYIAALLDVLKAHPDYMGYNSRESYNGVEGKIDTKGERVTLVFEYEE